MKQRIIAAAVLLAAGAAHAADYYIAGEHRVGCRSEERYGQLVRFAASGDNEAFTQALTVGVMTGECTMFKAGEPVYLEDTSIFSGKVKVRRRGEMEGYWTAIEAAKSR